MKIALDGGVTWMHAPLECRVSPTPLYLLKPVAGDTQAESEPPDAMSIVLHVSDPHFGTGRAPVVEALVQLGFYQFFYPEVFIMKAARIHGPKVVTYDRVPDPKIVRDTDLILKVTAICDSDLHIYSGGIVPVLGVYPASYGNFPIGQFFG